MRLTGTIQRLVWSFRSRSIGATHRPPERWGFCHPHRPIDKLINSDVISTFIDLIACVSAFVVHLRVEPYIHLVIMSRAAKATFAATGLGTASIIWFVHWAQEADRAAMHKGVERDMEKQRIRLERQAEFEMQKALEQEYLKLQTVHSTNDDSSTTNNTSNPGS
ncbi:unnamed protein product [Penicillium salamii]|uniref:Uncharacterized protein n=1 Tax=Penicillium salamii TaxID=1612424 RepID=A0A9W4K0Z9_9EURO|nr:unnamed protein product [Penicillium salamii]CAG8074906.1 unnamed protein product [Penicillium salamii]CAG8230097.1 unnamed protein product [Penicillium salamii]CAG8246351.1 unnamed protein product [Penicillium salamii]CAG8304123.1 unnamed protein product [Penicillium salamii]